jgi:interferon-induced GTP-binding protein Mx1
MRRHGVDSQGNLLEMITLVQAYWDIASRRFVDNVCMHMEKGFVARVVSDLETQSTLFACTCSEIDLAHMMQEDVAIAKKRADISEKIKVLQAAADILDNVTLPSS